MERLTERVRGESFPLKGITYMEIVEQLATYEDREEGIKWHSGGTVQSLQCTQEFDEMVFSILQELISTNQNYSHSLDIKMQKLFELMIQK